MEVRSVTIERNDERVLVFAPTGRDAVLTCSFLERAGIDAQACRDMSDVVHKVEAGCGAIVLAEETLGTSSVQTLTSLLSHQPSWSEIPICIITSGGFANNDTSNRLSIFNSVGSVMVLERPFRPETLVNSLQVALRSRRRQYQVRDLLDQRTATLERFRLMAETMPQKVFTATPSGEVDYLNQQWLEFADVPAGNGSWTQLAHPDDLYETAQLWKCSLQTGKPYKVEHRLRRRDGSYRWHLSRARALRSSSGTILLWIGSNTDIDSPKRASEELERLVEERTASLRETNKQLEAFCYTISHDLRAPLRAQQGFSMALIEEFGDALGETGREYAGRIHQAATRLDSLVKDLLAYSRISRADITLTEVDVQKTVAEVSEEMAYEIKKAKAKVVIEPCVYRVQAQELILRTALTNLMTNALKFTKPDVAPELRIAAAEVDNKVRLWVEDNGIGIAPEHQHQIFGVFQRLHRAGEYPGTGVGLAIVQKGIQRMGGNVGVESQEGSGSRFWIELKKAG